MTRLLRRGYSSIQLKPCTKKLLPLRLRGFLLEYPQDVYNGHPEFGKVNREMTKIYLVRHGRAAASWAEDLDPGLDQLGRSQALQAAKSLTPMAPVAIVTSPLKRAQETSQPLTELLNKTASLDPRVAEIPSPGLDPAARGPWLGKVMRERWSNLSDELQAWKSALIASLHEFEQDTAVFSHFIAINVAVGEALGDDRVVGFRPDNGSISILETDGAILKLVEKGVEASTSVG